MWCIFHETWTSEQNHFDARKLQQTTFCIVTPIMYEQFVLPNHYSYATHSVFISLSLQLDGVTSSPAAVVVAAAAIIHTWLSAVQLPQLSAAVTAACSSVCTCAVPPRRRTWRQVACRGPGWCTDRPAAGADNTIHEQRWRQASNRYLITLR